jgi:anti-sigma-K factor RskA
MSASTIELDELLLGQLLGELSDSDTARLEELTSDRTDIKDRVFELEKLLANLHLAMDSKSSQPLPSKLISRIESDAVSYFSELSSNSVFNGVDSHSLRDRWRTASGWLVATAAIVLAMIAWWPTPETPTAPIVSAEELRQKLISNSDDVIVRDWSEGKTPFDTPVTGDVAWSNQQQSGFMRFVGLPVNDPTNQQYQLWIIDPERDDEPIDGGVFDATSTNEIVVPIHAKLGVIQPTAFAITIEQPGGVVVSSQEQLPLLASIN